MTSESKLITVENGIVTLYSPIIQTENVLYQKGSINGGAIMPKHSHDGMEIVSIISGTLKFSLFNGKKENNIIGKGQHMIIPPNIKHQCEALEDAWIFVLTIPPEKDFIP